MWKLYIFRAFQISDGSSEFQYPEIYSGRETETFHSTFDENIFFFPKNAKLFRVFVSHLGIIGFLGSGKPFSSENTGLFDLVFQFLGCFRSFFMFREILYLYTGNPNKEVDSIENRPRKLGTVPFNLRFATDTGFFLVSEKSARTRIQSSDEDEFCRVGITRIHSIDTYFSIFEWLSKHLQEFPVEFQKFIEKEYSFMSETNLPRTTVSSSSDDTYSACGMVNFAKWSSKYERMIFG